MVETQVQENKQDFSIEDHMDFWRLNNVKNQNGLYHVIDLSKTLLPVRTQEEHAKHAIEAKKQGDFHLADFSLDHSIFTFSYLNKDNPDYKEKIEEARLFLKNAMYGNFLTSLTRIRYNPKGKDTIIHNYMQEDQHGADIDFTGKDGYIIQEEIKAEKPLQALLQTDQSVKEINSVYRWINNTDAYIWRLNQKPKSIDERVARFRVGSDGVGLYCGRNPQYSDSGLGVRYAEGAKKTSGLSLEEVKLSDEIFSSTKGFVQEHLQGDYRKTLEKICQEHK